MIDTVPAMLGKKKSSFTGLVNQETDVFLCATENICSGFSEIESMKNATDMVLKIIPYRCANAMNCHQFMKMLEEIEDSEFSDLLFWSLFTGGVVAVL